MKTKRGNEWMSEWACLCLCVFAWAAVLVPPRYRFITAAACAASIAYASCAVNIGGGAFSGKARYSNVFWRWEFTWTYDLSTLPHFVAIFLSMLSRRRTSWQQNSGVGATQTGCSEEMVARSDGKRESSFKKLVCKHTLSQFIRNAAYDILF